MTSGPFRPEQIDSSFPVSAGKEEVDNPRTTFSSYMQNPEAKQAGNDSYQSNLSSPFEMMQKTPLANASAPTMQTLITQTSVAQTSLGDVNTQLNYPNLKLKASQKYLLKNKLGDASTLLRSANGVLGNDPGLPPDVNTANPLGKFMSLVNDGANQIQSVKEHLAKLSENGDMINPADMLLVQIKLNKAQQEIEFSSILLSKVVEDFKTLMNVQI